MFLFSVNPGEEVIDSITRQLKSAAVTTGAIVSAIGAVDSCALSNMLEHDASSDVVTEFDQSLELSGTGEINDGLPHLHVVISGQGNTTYAGHLHWANVKNHFVNIYVLPGPTDTDRTQSMQSQGSHP